ncbi:MAG: pseudouridine synthase [Fibrobacterales bacterium]
MSFPILYHDEHMVAMYKPPGILVHRSALSTDTVTVLQLLRDQLGQKLYPVHRLDRPTSGVLLFGLSSEAARELSLLFRYGKIEKTYEALVRGWVDTGVIDKPLLNERGDEYLEAQTEFRLITKYELPIPMGQHESVRYAHVACLPKTGRMHQIRRHMKSFFHPIVGDTAYGEGRHNTLFRERFDTHRLMLNATSISFTHWESNQKISINIDDEHYLPLSFLQDYIVTGEE